MSIFDIFFSNARNNLERAAMVRFLKIVGGLYSWDLMQGCINEKVGLFLEKQANKYTCPGNSMKNFKMHR